MGSGLTQWDGAEDKKGLFFDCFSEDGVSSKAPCLLSQVPVRKFFTWEARQNIGEILLVLVGLGGLSCSCPVSCRSLNTAG